MLENGQMVLLNIRDILPNRFQPRIHFDNVKLNELAESIRKYGLIQPIVVRQIGNKFEIIAGERRFKASTMANRETVPAIILNISDRESEELALLENIQREDLTPIEEAVSYKRILDAGYITQEELAKKIGKTQATIANKIRLLNLDDQVQDALLHGKISERHARSLLRINNHEQQSQMLKRIIDERLTVKMVDKEINQLLENEEKTVNLNTIIPTVQINDNGAKPVSSHKIIRVNPPIELEPKIEEKGKEPYNMNNEQQNIMPGYNPQPINQGVVMPQANPTPVVNDQPIPAQPMNQEMIQTQPAISYPNTQVGPTIIPNEPVTSVPAPVNNVEVPIINEPPMPTIDQNQVSTVEPVSIPNPVLAEPAPMSMDSPVTDNIKMDIPDDDIIEPDGSVSTVVDSTPAPVNTPPIQFTEVLNVLRNASSTIEKLGFYVKLDEIDMGNTYQATFIINKN